MQAHPPENRKGQRGVALLVAIFAVALISYIAVEVSYETAIEYSVSRHDYDSLKAYYAAKSGVELSLLRIQIYQQVLSQFGEQLKGQTQMVDLLWQFPFAWPLKPPENMTRVSKEEIETSAKESLMDSQYTCQIQSEGAKIDLNDLASPSQALQEATRKQLQQLFENRLSQEDTWAEKHQDYNIEELLNDLADWVDADSESRNGGDEKSRYQNVDADDPIPPNHSFKTMEEVQMVRGMTDDIYQVLAPNITVYGLKGINVNYAEANILKSIDPQITDEIAKDIISRRTSPDYGPFKSEDDFKGYLGSQQIDINRFNDAQIPLYFDAEYNFRVQCAGQSGRARREIIAIIYDFDTVKGRLEKLLATPTPSPDPGKNPGNPPTSPSPSPSAAPKRNKGKPSVIYWYEM